MQFPDPHFKKKHHKRRIVQAELVYYTRLIKLTFHPQACRKATCSISISSRSLSSNFQLLVIQVKELVKLLPIGGRVWVQSDVEEVGVDMRWYVSNIIIVRHRNDVY